MNEPARSESLDARAWWTLAVVVGVVLIAYLGFSAGMMSSSDDGRTESVQSAGADEASEDRSAEAGSADANSSGSASNPATTDIDSRPLDAQSLREFGELGVLPGLLDDFSSVPDCDFDDALSTCQ